MLELPLLHVLVACHVPVAQLDRASACGAEGRRFESCRVHQRKDPIERWGLFFGQLHEFEPTTATACWRKVVSSVAKLARRN
jgi:hypothetical protein